MVDSRASSASHRFRTDAKAVRAPTGSLSAFSHSLVQLIMPGGNEQLALVLLQPFVLLC